MLYELIYTSTPTRTLERPEIEGLLTVARQKNKRANVTGLLIYDDLGFLQLLEGERSDVKSIFEAIQVDDRHKSVTVFHDGEIANRNFDEWSMAYRRIGPEQTVEGWGAMLEDQAVEKASGQSANLGFRLLKLLQSLPSR